MIVTQGIATTARARALTLEKANRKWVEWAALPVDHPLKRVEDLIAGISQDVFWAGRLYDLEDEVWRLLFFTKQDFLREGTGNITKRDLLGRLAELKSLTVDDPEGGWWFTFDLSETPFTAPDSVRYDLLDAGGNRVAWGVASQVPLAEWEAMQPERLRRPFPYQGDGTIKTTPKNRKGKQRAGGTP
jgi:hypothetical protein